MGYERNYIGLVEIVVSHGDIRPSRVGTTRSLFCQTLSISDLSWGFFPVLTTRQLYPKPVFGELAAFIRGAEDLATFRGFGCNYWDANAAAWEMNRRVPQDQMRVGKIYGSKWRDFHGVDQLEVLLDGLKSDKYSRRHVLTTWDPSETDQCLPPCHLLTQFYVSHGTTLNATVYMRSVDLLLGLPSDVILYSTLLLLICKELNMSPGRLNFQMGDCHVYENHLDAWSNQNINPIGELPLYSLSDSADLRNFLPSDIAIPNYDGHPRIHYALNV